MIPMHIPPCSHNNGAVVNLFTKTAGIKKREPAVRTNK
jgi:hypothetical protein